MTTTFEHGPGFAREPRGELFLRATTMFYGQDSFYEDAAVSDARSKELARDLAVTDWGWFSEFLVWLRSKGNIRTMSSVLAAEGVQARLNSKVHGTWNRPVPVTEDGQPIGPGLDTTDLLSNRQVIDKVLQRPDEPGKMLLYYFENFVPGWKPGSFTSKSVPQPIKRGLGDALTRMLNQRQALRYDKPGDKIRLGDVIEICHPKAKDELQGILFRHLITSRHDREGYEPPVELDEIRARWVLNGFPPAEREAFAKTISTDPNAAVLWRKALAGSWEWGKLWLGEK